MGSKASGLEDGILALFFNNTNFANVGDATGLRGSTTAGVFWLSLHTASPGESGTQATNEATYGGYARQSVVRSGTGWNCGGSLAYLHTEVDFPKGTSGSETATHVGIGSAETGTGHLFYFGALTPSIPLGTGITPILPGTDSSSVYED